VLESSDFERGFCNTTRTHDLSPVVPSDNSSPIQYDDDDNDAATENGDSKEEVGETLSVAVIFL